MPRSFRLVAIAKGGSASRGYRYLGYDKREVTRIGAWVKLEGTSGIHEAHVVKVDRERQLIAVKHKGYTSYIDRGSGNRYSPAEFVIYAYDEVVSGNEIHLYVDLFGIMELPLGWKPEWVRSDDDAAAI